MPQSQYENQALNHPPSLKVGALRRTQHSTWLIHIGFHGDRKSSWDFFIIGFRRKASSREPLILDVEIVAACFRAMTTISVKGGRVNRSRLNHSRTWRRIRFRTTAFPTCRLVLKPIRGARTLGVRALGRFVIKTTNSGVAVLAP